PLIDPAPALNALTVGGIARWDQTYRSYRYPGDLGDRPVAQRDQPSPFTRCGYSVRGAIKPDLVAYGGNLAISADGQSVAHQWLGEVTFNNDFAAGPLITERGGTSFAAPAVAHLAAKLLNELPDAGNALLRAL